MATIACSCVCEADLRYEGQASELTVAFAPGAEARAQMRERFLAQYRETYGYQDETAIELVKLRLIGRGLRPLRLDFAAMRVTERPAVPSTGSRDVSFERGARFTPAAIVARAAIGRDAAAGAADHRRVRHHHRRPARRGRVSRRDRRHRHGDRRLRVKIDPITFAVIKNALDSIVDDMAYTVMRTARSEIVKDVMDYLGRALRRRRADGGAGQDHRAAPRRHAGSDGRRCWRRSATTSRGRRRDHERSLSRRHAPARHLHVHADLRRRASCAPSSVVICHHTDVGGRVPGSNASDSTEIYQEGLRIPPLKLFERGRLERDAGSS